MPNEQELSKVIGANAKRLRLDAGATLEQVSRAAREHGLPYSFGRVGDLEGGRVQATLPTLLAVAATLAEVTGRGVTLAELLHADGPVRVTDAMVWTPELLQGAVTGSPVQSHVIRSVEDHLANPTLTDAVRVAGWPSVEVARQELAVTRAELAEVLAALDRVALADRRAATRLGRPPVVLVRDSLRAWGRLLSEERDRRAGPDANTQHRAIVTRELVAELRDQQGAS